MIIQFLLKFLKGRERSGNIQIDTEKGAVLKLNEFKDLDWMY
jgi:hypothetical protein